MNFISDNFQKIRHQIDIRGGMNTDDAYEFLYLTSRVLIKNNLFWFAAFGTALGLYRNFNFIYYDEDLDIGLNEKSFNKLQGILNEFEKYNFELLRDTNNLISIGYKGNYLDFYKFIERDKVYSCGSHYYIPAEYLKNLFFIPHPKFYFVPIPSPCEEYLKFVYNSDWSIPQRGKNAGSINNWKEFNKTFKEQSPSSSAIFMKNKIKKNGKILDLGSGNGRDSLYFMKEGFKVTSFDQHPIRHNNIKIIQGDFNNLDKLVKAKFDMIFCRFVFHSIEEITENIIINFSKKHLNDGGIFAFEFRIEEKVDYVFAFGDHFRRRIKPETFINKISNLFEYKEIHYSIGRYSKYKEEDPLLLRGYIIEKVK